jgi:hypothetical protein
MLPNSYVLPAVGAINVFTYGAKGDGTTSDLTAIQNAASALTPGQGLFFPATGSSYVVGLTTVTLPPQCSLHGVAGLPSVRPARSTLSTNSPLALCGDWTGVLSPTAGHVFDANGGRTLHSNGPAGASLYSGPALPGRGANEYLMVFSQVVTNGTAVFTGWTDDGFATLELSDLVTPLPAVGESFIDPAAVILPNGDILVACMHIASGNPGSIQFYVSTDGGRTWTFRTGSEIKPTGNQKFAEVSMVRSRMPGTGTPNRVIVCYMVFDRMGANDTVFQCAYSDDECVSVHPLSLPATATSGPSSAGKLADAGRAALYEIATGPTPGRLGLVYTRREAGVPAEIWGVELDNVGNPLASPNPVKLTTVPRQAGSGGTVALTGCQPVVQRLRTGEYALYFTACDFDAGGHTGELHIMSCPPSATGDPTQFVQDRLVSITTNAGGGYGRVWPLPKPNGEIELLMSTAVAGQAAQLISAIHYGAA